MAGQQVLGIHLMNIGGGVGVAFPAAEVGYRQLNGHIQPEHQIGSGQTQITVLKLSQPAKEIIPRLDGHFGGLMDGIGGGIAVQHHQTAILIELSPVLLVTGVAVYGIEGGSGKGVDIGGAGAELTAQIHTHQSGGFFGILGVSAGAEFPACLLQSLAGEVELGGLAGAVRTLKYDQFTSHIHHLTFP